MEMLILITNRANERTGAAYVCLPSKSQASRHLAAANLTTRLGSSNAATDALSTALR